MKVLLLQDIEKVGKRGEIVDVKDGYARNYLIPKKLASIPGKQAFKELELIEKKQKRLEEGLIAQAKEIKKGLETIPFVTIESRANEQGILYGSLSPSMITEALKEHKLKIEPKQIEFQEHIKQIGDYEVRINLFKDIHHILRIKVKPSEEVKPAEYEEKATQQEQKQGPDEASL